MASFANYLRQKLRGARRNDKANEEVNEVEDQRRWLRAWLRGQKPAGSILWASENVAESPLLHPLPCLPLGYQQNEADSYHYYDPIKNLKVTNKVTRNIWYSECVSCLQVETRGIVVSLREDNRMINGTYLLMTTALVDGFQIMKTLVDIQPQRVVQREPSPFNGTWIPYEQALAIANSEGIAEMLYPLFANSPPGVSYRSGSQTSWQTQDSSLLSTVGSSAPSSSAYNWSLNSSGSGYCTSSALTTPERSPDNTCDASEEPYQVAFGEPSHTSREYHMNPGCPVALPFEYHGREVDQGRDVLPIPHPESELGQKVGSELHLLDPSSIDNEPVTMLQEIHQAQHPPTLTPPSTKSFSIRRKPLNQSPTIEVSIEHEAESRSSTGESSLQSSLSSSSSSSSSSSDELRLHSKEGQKKVLLNRLMGYFYEVFFSSPMRSTSFTRHGTSSEQSDPQSKDSSTSTSMTSASVASGYLGTSQASGKRRASGEEDREQEEEGRPPQRRRGKDIQDSPVDKLTKRLACPYFKMDSARYRATRACIGPGWKSVHRIKEHLYRCHSRPIICPRCNDTFDTERNKDQHIAAEVICEVAAVKPHLEGFDSTQKELLRCRKKTKKYMTEVDKWYEVYMILFPGADPVHLPTPFYEYCDDEHDQDSSPDELSRYEQFLRRELPTRVRQELEVRIEEALNPVEENLQTQIVDIVRDLQVQLFDLYRSSRTTPPVGTGGGVAEIPAQAQQEQQPLQWIQAGPSTAQQEYSVAGGGLQHTVLDWNPPTIDELELFRPEAPFNDESFNDFSGELFNFQSASMDNPNSPSDSGYASLAILPDFSLFKTHGSQQSDPK